MFNTKIIFVHIKYQWSVYQYDECKCEYLHNFQEFYTAVNYFSISLENNKICYCKKYIALIWHKHDEKSNSNTFELNTLNIFKLWNKLVNIFIGDKSCMNMLIWLSEIIQIK